MRNLEIQTRGTWWRFSRYEISDGYIRPARGASLEADDPWRAYWSPGSRGLPTPYLRLVEVVRHLPKEENAPLAIDGELSRDILEWCKRFGLLGLLPHVLLSARLGSRLVERVGDTWHGDYSRWEPEQFGPPWAEVIIVDEFGSGAETWAEDAWWDFFPNVDKADWERHELRVPLSKEFWQEYAEPVEHFLRAARSLANAVEVIGTGEPIQERSGSLAKLDPHRLDRSQALERLNQLTWRVTSAVEPALPKGYTEVIRSPSLLGHLATQAKRDLLGGKPPVLCECGVAFSLTHPRRKYCSLLCADKYRQRDWRSRHISG